MPKIIDLKNEKDVQRVISDKNKLTIIDFYADWCGPCKVLGKKYHEFADEYKGDKIIFCSLDADCEELRDFVTANDVTALPTVLFLRGDDVKGRLVGADWKKFLECVEAYVPHTTHTTHTSHTSHTLNNSRSHLQQVPTKKM
jgi:thioredoxin 1